MKIYVRQEDITAALEQPRVHVDPIEATLHRRGYRARVGFTMAEVDGTWYYLPPKAQQYVMRFINTKKARTFSFELTRVATV